MKIDKTIEELIEGYNEGSLSREEILWVEEKIKSDVSFAEEVALDKQLKEIVVGSAFADLRSQMDKDLSQIENRRKYKIVAASIGAIILLSALVYTYTFTSSEENTHIQKMPSEVITTEASTEVVIVAKEEFPIQEEKIVINEELPEKKNIIEATTIQETIDEVVSDEHTVAPISEPVEKEIVKTDVVVEIPKTIDVAPCNLQFDIASSPTCLGQFEGQITVVSNTIRGFTKPYHFVLNGGLQNELGQFKDLTSGVYTITMVDAQNCEKSKEVEVKTKSCLPKEVSFNPVYGEKAELIEAEGDVKMSIFNRAGVLIYESIVESGNKTTWSGVTTDGGNAAVGLYICVLQKEDQTKETVQISLLR